MFLTAAGVGMWFSGAGPGDETPWLLLCLPLTLSIIFRITCYQDKYFVNDQYRGYPPNHKDRKLTQEEETKQLADTYQLMWYHDYRDSSFDDIRQRVKLDYRKYQDEIGECYCNGFDLECLKHELGREPTYTKWAYIESDNLLSPSISPAQQQRIKRNQREAGVPL
jgi:hypothetical protein